MPDKEYGCYCCKVVFAQPEAKKSEDETDVECPYCGGADIQKLSDTADTMRFIRSVAYSGG